MSKQHEAAKALQQKGADDTQPPKPVDPLVEIKKLFRRFGHIGAGSRLAWLIDEVERARALLREMEWAGHDVADGQECYFCGNRPSVGHDAGCELAALIV